MAESEGERLTAAQLRAFAEAALQAVGVGADDAQTVAWALVEANLEGIDTHGISRLALYVRRVRAGLAAARPAMLLEHPAPAVGMLDGDNALGPVAAVAAMDEAIRLASLYGVGMVAVAHTNHAAALSTYAERAAAANCFGFMVCNTPPGMPPWGGTKALLGTNPLAFAAPGPEAADPPVVVDLATTVVARGNIIMAARQNQPIPAGWAIDAEGQPTTDAKAALAGSVLPMAGPKGYALALMVEMLAATLSGAGWGPNVHSPYDDWTQPTDAGLWCLAIHLGPLMSAEVYQQRLGGLIDAIHATPASPGTTIRVPGERRAQVRASRLAEGIPVDGATRKELDALASEINITPLPGRTS